MGDSDDHRLERCSILCVLQLSSKGETCVCICEQVAVKLNYGKYFNFSGRKLPAVNENVDEWCIK